MAPQQQQQNRQGMQRRALRQPPPVEQQDSSDSSGEDSRIVQLRACGHSGDVEIAERLLFVLESELQGSMDVYNFVIHACATARDVQRAELHFVRMEAKGFKPNLVTFNSMINSCAASGDGEGALSWLRRMVDCGITPSAVTYSTICKVFARQGSVRLVKNMMDLFEIHGGTLNEYFYASLISACGVAKPADVSAAIAGFDDLVARGLRPQSVKKALVRAIGRDRTSQLFASLEASQRRPSAPAATQQPAPPSPKHFAQQPSVVAAADNFGPPSAAGREVPEPRAMMGPAGPRPVGVGVGVAPSVGAMQAPPPGLEQPLPGFVNRRRFAALARHQQQQHVQVHSVPVSAAVPAPAPLPGYVEVCPPAMPPSGGLLGSGPKWMMDRVPISGAMGANFPASGFGCYLEGGRGFTPPPLPTILAAGPLGMPECGLFQEQDGPTFGDDMISDPLPWKAKAQAGRISWRLHV